MPFFIAFLNKSIWLLIPSCLPKIFFLNVINKQLLCKVYWNKYPGISYLEVPEDTLDPYYTVIAIVLDSPIKLFNKKSGAVELN